MNRTGKTKRTQLALMTVTLLIFSFFMLGSEKALTQSSLWTTSSSNPNNIYNTNTGFVGIGTATPAHKLHVFESSDSFIFAKVQNPNNGVNSAVFVKVEANTAATDLRAHADARSITRFGVTLGGWSELLNTSGSGLAIGTFHSAPLILGTNSANRLHITSNGDIGIGTTTPTKKLDVVGDINASGTITGGNIIAKYQDIAEWVLTDRRMAAGTVVVLDANRSNAVIPSSSAYDTRVAGVVSENPGVILGEAGAGKAMIATTGRVRVKVDATKGPIGVGDLLVTSEEEGMAMKSEAVNVGGVKIHRPGTIIGKALEPLARGKGEILVLLSLQ
jgi:hypothetical protein